MKNFLKYIFSVDTKSSNRVIVYFLGIKFRHLKASIKDKYEKYTCPVSEIPKATGILRKIQLANLKMMLIFDKLCKENNYQYWIDFGNLLGAVRHGGFIPWDDDVDLGMVRDDYENFIEKYKNGIPDDENLYLEYNNNGKNKCFLKIKHKNLPNVALDIFPYDFYYKRLEEDEKLLATDEMRKARNKFIYRLLQPFYMNNPEGMRKRFFKIRDNVVLKGNKVKKEEMPSLFYGLDYPHPYKNYFFDYDKIFPLKKIKFENRDLACPNDDISILEQVFGDYMSIPDDCYPRHANSESFDEKALDEFIGDINE